MHKHRASKHKSKRVGEGQWSDWVWSEDHQRHYAYRLNSNGEYEYHWEAENVMQQNDETIPRDQPGVDEITEGLEALSTSPSTHESGYNYIAQPGENDGYGQVNPASHGHSSRSRKGKGVAYEDEPEYPYELQPDNPKPKPQPNPAPPLDPFWGSNTQLGSQQYGEVNQKFPLSGVNGEEKYVEPNDYHSANGQTPSTFRQDSGYVTTDLADDYDPDLEQAKVESYNQMYGVASQGESSTDPVYGSYEPPGGDEPYDDEGPATPTAPMLAKFDINGTFGHTEALDSRFVVERSIRFSPGQIFKVLWSEPSGSSLGGTPTISTSAMTRVPDPYGGSVFVGFRRFIVIANDEGHCTCVPILTYQGKGCNKSGVKANRHGIIYAHSKHPPKPLPKEPKLGFPPVRAKMLIEGEKLAKESRINYAKLVTVEHNVKVFFIGYIPAEGFEDVTAAVDACWERKNRRHK
ncbi:hypothetical protein CCHL11_01298 [Colletotrichum chlorophyti]|uniref:DUF6590 domain-containing protein n=1 Tax=Colletotrichum chlorophyti TaxID=708187 RepID=A0A1Q8S7V5_9PEZI|nr:hypothetical protein CCHL11_01298 [Colletotrichum chlorophyti]